MNKKRVLLADDEESVRRLVAATLGREDYEVLFAGDGEEALQVVRDQNPQLVLLDITMPKMDGFQVCRALKSDRATRDTKIIMLTARGTELDKLRGQQVGADGYFVKPFSPLALLNQVRAALSPEAPGARGRRKGLPTARPVAPKPPGPKPEAGADASQRQLLLYAEDLSQAYRELQQTFRETLEALVAALDARDAETEDHSRRVASFALATGRAMGLSEAEMAALEWGALLHDVGKIGIADAILRKPGPLSEPEWAQMRQHSEWGFQILRQVGFLAGALPVVRYHHERYDGQGYPQGLAREDIPLAARIFAVADAYDAITSRRPYRPARSPAEAREEIVRHSGSQFCPQVVKAFLELYGRGDLRR